MTGVKEQKTARFPVEVELANDSDLVRAKAGVMTPQQIRRARVSGLVDSGATRLVIPETLVKQLGLEISGTVGVRYADGRTADRSIAQRIRLSYGGRESVFNAIVEPGRESVLIGAIVLEDLDFYIDCTSQRLVPRDPRQIVSEVE